MLTSSTDPPKKLRPTKFSRHLTTKIPMNNYSTDDHYHGGVSVSVPFRWESEPGTPKLRCRESPLPPLTPPPSHYSSTLKSPIRENHNKSNLWGSIFRKRTTNRKTDLPSSLASSSSSSSSETSPWSTSYSVSSSPMRPSNFRERFDSWAQEEVEDSRAISSLCFARSRGPCYSSLIKILFRNSQ